jgi:dUTP pyrophosphatase
MNIKIKLSEGAKMPLRSTDGAAGWDLFAHIEKPFILQPGNSVVISTGIAIALPNNHYWDLRVRSGLSTKHQIILLNGAAVIDEDYRGIVGVPLYNLSNTAYKIQPGEKIAQAILKHYHKQEFEIVEELPTSERGARGFGSTGK